MEIEESKKHKEVGHSYIADEDEEDGPPSYRLLPTKAEIKLAIAILILALVTYGGLYMAIGEAMLPGGTIFPIILIWLSAHAVGWLITKVKMPSLLGMLAAGIILANLPGAPVASLDKKVAKEIRYGALAVIFLRSGLEQDPDVFKKVGSVAVRLLLIPGILEALVSGSVGIPVFAMPVALSFAMGFILKPVDPAIAIQLMFNLQQEGKGVAKGIPALVVAAASFDDLVAITFYTLCISLALPPSEGQSQVFQLLKGPLNIVLGAVLGLASGTLCSMTKIWNTRLLRTMVVLLCALAQMYASVKYDFSGAGVLSAIILGVMVNFLWTKGQPRWFSKGQNPHYGMAVEHHVALFWDWVAQPLLFGIVGTSVNFKYLDASTIPKSILVICSGWLARMPTTFFAVAGAGLTWRERAFVMLAWTPKASVQAALATAPMDEILAKGLDDEWIVWGDQILVTALFAVLICGPLGVIATTLGAKLLMKKDPVEASGASILSVRPLTIGGPDELMSDAGMPSFIKQVDEELLHDKHEDEVLLANNAKMGKLLVALENDINELQDTAPADSEGAEAAARMHKTLRKMRKQLLAAEVPHMDHIDGARDFFACSLVRMPTLLEIPGAGDDSGLRHRGHSSSSQVAPNV